MPVKIHNMHSDPIMSSAWHSGPASYRVNIILAQMWGLNCGTTKVVMVKDEFMESTPIKNPPPLVKCSHAGSRWTISVYFWFWVSQTLV